MKRYLYAKMCEFMGYWLVCECNTKKHIKCFGFGKEGEMEAQQFIETAKLYICKDGHTYWRVE